MSITSMSAKDLARLGANIIITPECRLTSQSVKDIIRIAVGHKSTVTIYAGDYYTSMSLKDFARLGGSYVTIAI